MGRLRVEDFTGNGFVQKHNGRGAVKKLAENLGLHGGVCTRPLRKYGDEPGKPVRQLSCFYFSGERRRGEQKQKGRQFHWVTVDSLENPSTKNQDSQSS